MLSISLSHILILIAIGIWGGFLSGLFGIGGSGIMIPALILALGISQHQAQGIALGVLMIPVTLPAFINYYKQRHIKIKNILFTLIGFIAGGYLGSSVAVFLSGPTLKKIFAVFLLSIVAKYFFADSKKKKE